MPSRKSRHRAPVQGSAGVIFGYDLIEQVAHRPSPEVQLGLDRLAAAELLFCRGIAPHSLYLFKHALVQDAAYGTLLRSRRQELHARTAAALEQNFTDLVERQAELLAHHLAAAGQLDSARPLIGWKPDGARPSVPLTLKRSPICRVALKRCTVLPILWSAPIESCHYDLLSARR
jgi:predicted ATPase